MSERYLPPSATLRYLKLEAKRLLKSARAGDRTALDRFARRPDGRAIQLAEAQRVIAREYGLASWSRLKLRVAELVFARTSDADKRAAVIDAVCAWGWDHEHTATLELAQAIVASAGALVHGDPLLACITGDVEVVRDAIARDPDFARRAVSPRGWEPLLHVSYSVLLRGGHARAAALVEVARLLLAHGADPNCHYVAGDYRFPALYAAIAVTDNLELARVLLDAGANPNDKQSLYHAAERHDLDALELLVAHDVDPADLSYCLLHKIDFQHEPGVRWFLDHGADPNVRHPASGESALHWAIKRASSVALVELLLAHGADPNARTLEGHTVFPDVIGFTPLDLALRLGRADLAVVLRERSAVASPPTGVDDFVLACAAGDPRARDRVAAEPGLVAKLPVVDHELMAHLAQQNQGAAVELMLELGFPPDVRGWMSATPLHWAACRGNVALVERLLSHGAPLVDVGGYFKTALHTATHCQWSLGDADHAGVARLLEQAGG